MSSLMPSLAWRSESEVGVMGSVEVQSCVLLRLQEEIGFLYFCQRPPRAWPLVAFWSRTTLLQPRCSFLHLLLVCCHLPLSWIRSHQCLPVRAVIAPADSLLRRRPHAHRVWGEGRGQLWGLHSVYHSVCVCMCMCVCACVCTCVCLCVGTWLAFVLRLGHLSWGRGLLGHLLCLSFFQFLLCHHQPSHPHPKHRELMANLH